AIGETKLQANDLLVRQAGHGFHAYALLAQIHDGKIERLPTVKAHDGAARARHARGDTHVLAESEADDSGELFARTEDAVDDAGGIARISERRDDGAAPGCVARASGNLRDVGPARCIDDDATGPQTRGAVGDLSRVAAPDADPILRDRNAS